MVQRGKKYISLEKLGIFILRNVLVINYIFCGHFIVNKINLQISVFLAGDHNIFKFEVVVDVAGIMDNLECLEHTFANFE